MMNGHLIIRVLAYGFFACSAAVLASDVPFVRFDLRDFGYQLKLASYSSVCFLSDDILLVSINQPGEPAYADKPASTMVVFDVSRGNVTMTGKMAVEKAWNSVQAISKDRFAVLNWEGLHFCDHGLHCERIEPTKGPMFVSPQGKRIAVGGNGQTLTKVIDTETMKQVAVFDFVTGTGVRTIPGDEAILVDRNNQVTIQSTGAEAVLTAHNGGPFSEFRFLNGTSVAYLDSHTSEAVVAGFDGKQLRRYKVANAWGTGFLPAASGSRFAIYEHGYSAWNKLQNFPDIAVGRPENYQRVRVMDLSSGSEVFSLEWDPRPTQVTPALSPSGHSLARVKAGILEVFRVN